MQVFQPSSVLSVVVGQASRKYIVLCHDWLSVLSLMGTLLHHQVKFKPLGCCHRVTLEVPIEEGSRSLATDKMTSNHVISTVVGIGLIMSTSYFQNLS
jgi:hypothetical protein